MKYFLLAVLIGLTCNAKIKINEQDNVQEIVVSDFQHVLIHFKKEMVLNFSPDAIKSDNNNVPDLIFEKTIVSNNDSVWFAHKLRNRLVHEQDIALREKDVREALVGIRQALKDLGAL